MHTRVESHPHATLQPSGTMLTGHGNEIKVQFSHDIDGENGITTFIRTEVTLTLMQWREAAKAVEAIIAHVVDTGNGDEIISLSDVLEGVGA